MVKLHSPFIQSVLVKLIVTFLCVILPLYATGLTIYKWGMDTLSKEVFSIMQSQGDNYLFVLERDIQHLQTLQAELASDSNLNKLVNALPIMNRYEKTIAVQNLMDRLSAISHSSSLVDIIKVHLPEQEMSIYSTGTATEFEKPEYEQLCGIRSISDKDLILFNGIPHLLLPGSFNSTDGDPYTAYLIDIRLKNSELSRSIKTLSALKGEGAFLICSTSGEILASEPDAGIAGQLKSMVSMSNADRNKIFDRYAIGENTFLATYSHSVFLKLTLVKYSTEEEVFSPIRRYQIWFYVLTGMAIIVIILYSLFTFKFIGRPVAKLVYFFNKAEDGDLKIKINYKFNDEFSHLYHGFNRMMGKLDDMIAQVYEQKILVQRAELKQLQSQINPHFLYNSFFMLHRAILGGNNENAAELSKKLGNYFRYVTKNSSDNVLLQNEVEHARLYAEIQALRFENCLTLYFGELPEKYAHILVPRLILQPVLENSFEHGLSAKAGDGILRVLFTENSSILSISVENNGNTINPETISALSAKLSDETNPVETTGLINIHRRIRLMFGGNSGITVSRSLLGGLKVVLDFETKNLFGGNSNVQAADC